MEKHLCPDSLPGDALVSSFLPAVDEHADMFGLGFKSGQWWIMHRGIDEAGCDYGTESCASIADGLTLDVRRDSAVDAHKETAVWWAKWDVSG